LDLARICALMADIVADPLALPIQWHSPFVQAFVYYSCTSPEFWARIGYAAPPDLVSCPQGQDAARLILKALHEMIQGPVDPRSQTRGEARKHPGNKTLVLNHLYTQSRMGGRITPDQVSACIAYLEDDLNPWDLPTMESVIEHASLQLKARIVQQAQRHVFEAQGI
jgi:hypothetical protein